MPKISNEKIRKMTLDGIVEYTAEHPLEGARTAKETAKASAKCLELYIDAQIERAKKFATPPTFSEPTTQQ
jgi:hypothetical protein